MVVRIFILTFFLFFHAFNSYSQYLDSIQKKVEEIVSSNVQKEKSEKSVTLMDLNTDLTRQDVNFLQNKYLRKAQSSDNAMYELLAYSILADYHYYQNQMDSSFYFYLKQGQVGESLQEWQFSTIGYVNAAYVLEYQGKLMEAIQFIKKAEKVDNQNVGNTFMSSGYFNLAHIYHKIGYPDSASLYLKKVIEIDRNNGDLKGMVYNLQFLVDLQIKSGTLEAADLTCDECLKVSKEVNFTKGLGMCYFSKAFVTHTQGNNVAAKSYIEESIKYYLVQSDSSKIGKVLRLKANILAESNISQAESLFLSAIQLGKIANNPIELAKTGIDLASFYLDKKMYDKSRNQLDSVHAWTKKIADVNVRNELLDIDYQWYIAQGKWNKANDVLMQKSKLQSAQIRSLTESQANNANQSYEIFQIEQDLQKVAFENELNQIEAKRKIALVLIFCTLLLLSTIIAYLALKNQKNKNTILEKTSKEEKLKLSVSILEKELDALRSQMNPHFLFNSLNSINDYIMHENPQNASKYLTRFSKLMRIILSNSKKKMVPLEDELEAVKLYMEMEKLRFKGKFEFKMDIEDDVASTQIMIPAMLIQPYLENSIKHGIQHNQDLGLVRLSIRNLPKDRIEINIKDNGIGRKAALILKQKSDRNRKSFGTAITNDRINLLNKIYKVNASIVYIDHENPAGTEVILSLNTNLKSSSEWRKSELSL